MRQERGTPVKWRVWVACGLLLAVVVAGIATQYWIESLCDDLCRLLQTLPREQTLPEAKERWEHQVLVLSMLIRHDRVDQVTEAFARAEQFLRMGTEDECEAEIAEILSRLKWLRQYDKPNFRSIF
ncbi:MAG: DUF4363 family protein [Oscillospiraceae bacterium]|nr:DUF4363 family protein [Oscillospiraceae bacterium]